jgi:hypothetical protein
MGPPEIYPLVPEEPTLRLNYRNKIRIAFIIIIGCTLLLTVTMIFSLTVFKRFYQQKQTTTTTMTNETTVLTTVSTFTTQGEIVKSIYYFGLKFFFSSAKHIL